MPDIRARCHCGLADYSISLPESSFPLKSALCHCSSCRHSSGHAFVTWAVIPTESPPDTSHLTQYASSSTADRYFCPVCGASVLNVDRGNDQSEWEFATGIMDRTEGLLNRVQLFANDTGDGGAAKWLLDAVPEVHGRHRDSPLLSDKEISMMKPETDVEALTERCHCGDVQFTIDEGDAKYQAGLDACTSCRTVTGCEITAWATVPQKNVHPFELDRLKQYSTSPGVTRYFCGRCGATIFYLKEGLDSVDVGVGLLDGGGVRAEKYLDWRKYEDGIAYQDDAIDSAFAKSLADGVQRDRGG